MPYTAEQLGNALADAALSEWSRPVRDIEPGTPDDREHIAKYFNEVRRADGRSWAWFLLARHPRGHAEYIEQTMRGEWEEWCGMFVAFCAQNLIGRHIAGRQCVNLTIAPGIAYYVLPSTARIASPAKWNEAGVDEPERPLIEDMQRGDIFTVGAGGIGSHIGIVDEPPDDESGEFMTIEGNGRGLLGDGTRGEGVIRRGRNIREIKQLIRLCPEHYVGMADR
jgi:hypothetical protein